MPARLETVDYEYALRTQKAGSDRVSGARRGCLLRIDDGEGTVGFGEVAPLDADELVSARDALARVSTTDVFAAVDPSPESGSPLARVAEHARRALGKDAPPSARCGLEVALLDVLARRRGIPFAEILRPGAAARVEVNALLVEDGADEVRARTHDLLARGFRTLKLKVGRGADDVARVRATVDAAYLSARATTVAAPALTLRLDANRAWSFDAAVSVLDQLEGAPIDYIEEPLADCGADEMARLRRRSMFGIAVDESVSAAGDLERYAAAHACDVVVLKLQRVGGPSAALAMATQARAHGMRVVLTDSLESAVGRAATLHCAAACTSEAVGLAGAFLMDGDACGHDRPSFSIAGAGLGEATVR